MDFTKARALLKGFLFGDLFVNELGWDRHKASLSITVDGRTYSLSAFAHKRGMAAYTCVPPTGEPIPDRGVRRKIEHQVARTAHEHLIVFIDATKRQQIWQWVKREPGSPASPRETSYYISQTGDILLGKLQGIATTLEEEESLTLVDVTARVRQALDVDKITKRFYDRFQSEHGAFLAFIKGITDVGDREWYASVMLNRLMFVYFMQRKGFLDGDQHYLRNRLEKSRQTHGKDKFYSFYRYFLLRLFHEGLGGRARTPELEALIGRIPYLNGGVFDLHELERPERYGEGIQIPDKAFQAIFDFFDQYDWHLDERPLRAGNEINPDVLGYIFEKYINQKQMGAYYTKEDITDYICKNTIVSYLLGAARKVCNIAFENPNGPTVWNLLSENPDAYIYPAVRHGLTWDYNTAVPWQGAPRPEPLQLPEEIAAGIGDATKQTEWDRPAPRDFALPTETWRELISRRQRYHEIKAHLTSGQVRDIDDLVTLNLDIWKFAQDVIANSEGPELLRAFWNAIKTISILDPTCGSGAFLFAALRILEPLYIACLDRMEGFIAGPEAANENAHPQKFAHFRKTLADVDAHPNRRYFILKNIILSNLYGVDIMEEAVEICKLRLFLKLAAQVEPANNKPNFGIEPLPDIDFNIRPGNSLVGYPTMERAREAVSGTLDFANAFEQISIRATDLQQTFNSFRQRQVEGDGTVPVGDKVLLRERLGGLEAELNRFLAQQYGVDTDRTAAYAKWIQNHKPFHWFIEFHAVMEKGGFDVIIGNPPYVEVPKDLSRALLRASFKSALEKWSRDEDVYTMVVERSLTLLIRDSGRFGMILPLSVSCSTKKSFELLRRELEAESGSWFWSHFDRIPSALFGNEVRTRCTIGILSRNEGQPARHFTTSLLRWEAEYRDCLLSDLQLSRLSQGIKLGIPKVASQAQADALGLLTAAGRTLAENLRNTIPYSELVDAAPNFPHRAVFVGGTAYNWFPAWREIPLTTDILGHPSLPARTAGYRFATDDEADVIFALLCSSLGYWWWAVASDGFNVKKWLLDRFPVSLAMIPRDFLPALARAGNELKTELARHYVFKDNKGRIGNFYLPACREQIIAIDRQISQAIPQLSWTFFEDIQMSNVIFSRANLTADEE